MGILLCGVEVFLVAKELIGIEQRFVHAAVFAVQKVLEGSIGRAGNDIRAPVGQFAEEFLGLVAAAVEVGVAQSGQYLVLDIERHPTPVAANLREVALIERFPRVVDRLSANETIETGSVSVVGILAILHHGQHVIHALLEFTALGLVVTGGIGQGQRREIVTAHVAAKVEARTSPVREIGVLGKPLVVGRRCVGSIGKAGLAHEGREQAVDVVLQQGLDVQVHCLLHRPVEKGDVVQVEVLGIKFTLCARVTYVAEESHQSDKDTLLFHEMSYWGFCQTII